MLELLRKDYLLNRKTLFIILAMLMVYSAWAAWKVDAAKVYLTFACLMSVFLPIPILAREDKFKGAVLTCSLPRRRSTVVLSRFLFSWMMIFALLMIMILSAFLFPWSRIEAAGLITLPNLFYALSFLTIVFAFLLPFTVRFGLIGIMVFLVALQFLGIIAMMTTRIFGRKGDAIGAVTTWIRTSVAALKAQFGLPGFFLFLLAVILVLNFLSIKISQWIYARRDL